MGAPEERETVRASVRRLLASDRASGARRPVGHYKNLFPGFWDLVDEEYGAEAPPPAPATTPSADAGPGAPTADRVGHYRLLRELGRGGMGVVWLAEDARIGRRVALKVLAPGFASSRPMLLRFQREAEAASRLDHPGICPVFEAEFEGETPHIAMRFVEGETLAQRVAAAREAGGSEAALPGATGGADPGRTTAGGVAEDVARVVVAIEKAARALHAAHEAGLVHRDVKPGNILVGTDGEPVLLDFGLARAEDAEESRLSRSGVLLGTPAYMSPEQLTAQRIALDRRTDVYSLGVTLYECLTLRLPFEAPTLEGMYQRILATEPEDPRRLNRRIPRDLAVVIETALQKDRDRRYATALDLAEDLRRVLLLEPIRARPTGPLEKGWRWARRNPALATTVVALYATLLLFVVVLRKWEADATEGQEYLRNSERLATIERDRARAERGRAEEAAARAREALEETARSLARTEAQRLLAESAAVRGSDPALALLLALEGHRRSPELAARNAVLAAFVECREERTLLHPGPVWDAAFSSDGRRVLTACEDGGARCFDADTGRPTQAFPGDRSPLGIARFLEGDRRVAAVAADGSVRILDLGTGAELERRAGPRRGRPQGLVHRGASARAAFTDRERCWVVDAGGGAGFPPAPDREFPGTSAALSADGRRLLCGATAGGAFLQDLALGSEGPKLEGQVHNFGVPVLNSYTGFSPDGARAVVGSGIANALWSTADGALRFRPDSGQEPPLDMDFSPDGRLLAAALREPRIWEVPGGTLRAVLRGGSGLHGRVRFSPDGRLLAAGSVDGVVRVWEVDGGGPPREFRGHGGAVQPLAFSPDGRRLLSGSLDGTARIWRMEPRPEALVLRGHRYEVVAASFDAPGARIATVSRDRTARVWDATTGAVLAEMKHEAGREPMGGADAWIFRDGDPYPGVFAARFGPDGRTFATVGAGPGARARLWDAGDGRLVAALPYYILHYLQCIDLAPDGSLLAIGQSGCRVQVHDARSGAQVSVPAKGVLGDPSKLCPVAFHPDSRRLALFRGHGKTVVADPRTGAVLVEMEGVRQVESLRFSPDGRLLAGTAGEEPGGGVVVWDAATGRALPGPAEPPGQGICLAAFAPDGRRLLAAGGIEGAVAEIRDLETGKEAVALRGHTRPVRAAAFSPDGRRAVTGARDGTARLWDAATGEELLTLLGHGAGVTEARFSPDGTRILTASSDGTARLWPLDPVAAAEAARPRDFTPAERERYGIRVP